MGGNDLTKFANGTLAGGGPLDGYSQGDGRQHVNFIASDGHVHELYRSPDPPVRYQRTSSRRQDGTTM
ncbi:MAG: hypothetical protein ACXV3F_17325, partial [Frankiaceae bacterium]